MNTKITIDIASDISNDSVYGTGHASKGGESIRENASAGGLPLLLGGSLVAPYGCGAMPCYFPDKLLINVLLVHFRGCC